MAWRSQRKRQCELQEFQSYHELLTATTIVQIIDNEEEERPHRGSVVGRKTVPRDKYSDYWRLMQDYFQDPPVYRDNHFHRRLVLFHGLFFGAYECENLYSLTCTSIYSFRMCKAMFIDICHAVVARNDYLKRKPNAVGLPGFTTVQKITVVLRILAYGGSADLLDEYFRMGKTTILESMDHFTRTVVDLYGQSYLRAPNAEDIATLLQKAEERGFPGMIGSIDCMHWDWEKCPTSWHGQYRGHHKKPTIVLKAVASYDLRIWHIFFGMPRSCNDINVLH
jgi:hypothetical protein